MEPNIWFGGGEIVIRVVVVGTAAGAGLALLRASGRRSVADMHVAELVTALALGMTLAAGLVRADVALSHAVLAFAVLLGLHAMAARLATHRPPVSRPADEHPSDVSPTVLIWRGRLLYGAMKAARVTEGEVLEAVHAAGLAGPSEAALVVLEGDGSLRILSWAVSSAHRENGARDGTLSAQRWRWRRLR